VRLQDVEPDADRRALVQAIIERVPALGWRTAMLEAASQAALADPARWRSHFPRGPVDAIWCVSTLSDASMHLPFAAEPSPSMSAVIAERFDQNAALKPFVRRVMQFDVGHPFQALARMQRTARVMFASLADARPNPSWFALAVLNVTYTSAVFAWLNDRSPDSAKAKAFTRRAMRLIGLS
jgi:hypothetical protein